MKEIHIALEYLAFSVIKVFPYLTVLSSGYYRLSQLAPVFLLFLLLIGRYSVLWRTWFTASFAIIELIHEPRHVVNEWLSVSLVVHFGFQVLLMKPSILSLGFLKISLFIIDTIQNLWKVKPVLGNCPQNHEW